MGKGTTKDSSTIIQEVGEQGTDTRGSNRSGSPSNAETERGTRGTDTNGDRGKGNEEKNVIPRLSSIERKENETEEQYKKRIERNEKRRQKYQEQKAKGTLPQGKPKKVNKQKKNDIDTSQVNIIIKTISSLIAARPGQEHWLLTDSEIESITTPLSKMLAESEMFNKLGEHSNQIALVTACITVFMPRVIITTTKIKEKKKNERKPKPTATNQNKVIDIDKRNDRGATTNSQNVSQQSNWLDSIVN